MRGEVRGYAADEGNAPEHSPPTTKAAQRDLAPVGDEDFLEHGGQLSGIWRTE